MKFLRHVFLLTAISVLLSLSVFAEPEQKIQIENPLEESQIAAELETLSQSVSTRDFQYAYLVVNTNSYSAPNPNTSTVLNVVPANTSVLALEKTLCTANGAYYYFITYTYNSQIYRGYVSEYNVYQDGSRLLPANVDNESNPANLKLHTSLADTVYNGPGAGYPVVGSVGQQSINLIRTEGDYNFIQYTDSSTGKTNRGFLHYSKITGSWANLTAQISSRLNGKTFYVRNVHSGKYLDVMSWSTAENGRIHLYEFSGDTNQIYKFTYNASGKYFTIQPANNYTSNRRLAINSASNTEHSGRHLAIKTVSNSAPEQKFWIVEVGTFNEQPKYKILPLSGYGTMTITDCTATTSDGTTSTFVNQTYTSAYNTVDAWVMETTEVSTNAQHFEQEESSWCWIASAQCMASSEDGFYNDPENRKDQRNACIAVKNNDNNESGTLLQKAQAANYFIDYNIHNNKFGIYTDKVLIESDIRRLIHLDHSIGLSMYSRPDDDGDISGHAITLVKFKWIDKYGEPEAPGYYDYYYYDPLNESNIELTTTYNGLMNYTVMIGTSGHRWIRTTAYNSGLTLNPIAYNTIGA